MFSGFLARRWQPVIIATFVCAAVAGAAGLSAVLSLRSAGGQDPAREVASGQETPAVEENPVATVNGEPIVSTAFRARLRLQELNAAAGLPTATPMQIVDSIINDKLLRQEARRRGLECTDQQLRDFVGFHVGNLPGSQRHWLSETYNVPENELETSRVIARLYQGACAEVQVRRAIAAEHPDLSPEEAVEALLSRLRAASDIRIDELAIEKVVRDAAGNR